MLEQVKQLSKIQKVLAGLGVVGTIYFSWVQYSTIQMFCSAVTGASATAQRVEAEAEAAKNHAADIANCQAQCEKDLQSFKEAADDITDIVEKSKSTPCQVELIKYKKAVVDRYNRFAGYCKRLTAAKGKYSDYVAVFDETLPASQKDQAACEASYHVYELALAAHRDRTAELAAQRGQQVSQHAAQQAAERETDIQRTLLTVGAAVAAAAAGYAFSQ